MLLGTKSVHIFELLELLYIKEALTVSALEILKKGSVSETTNID